MFARFSRSLAFKSGVLLTALLITDAARSGPGTPRWEREFQNKMASTELQPLPALRSSVPPPKFSSTRLSHHNSMKHHIVDSLEQHPSAHSSLAHLDSSFASSVSSKSSTPLLANSTDLASQPGLGMALAAQPLPMIAGLIVGSIPLPGVQIVREILLALGGGTGATLKNTRGMVVDQDFKRRMLYQDRAVLIVIVLAYLLTLSFGWSVAYRQSANDSPVTYYTTDADPRHGSGISGTDAHDLDGFLDTFDQAPKIAQLQVSGFKVLPKEVPGGVDWRGQRYRVAFTFALDLSPWVTKASSADISGAGDRSDGEGMYAGDPASSQLQDGIVVEDRDRLATFLLDDSNDLAVVELRKEVDWPGWEDVAMHIKHQIRQRGFDGIVSVHLQGSSSVHVRKNVQWANFMHSKVTKALCALSLIGWAMYLPYVWLRATTLVVRSRYKVNIATGQYWDFIAGHITANGFSESAVQSSLS